MTPGRAGRESPAGVGPRSLRLVVDVDPGSSPLEGTLSAASNDQRYFVGLVELLAAVEDLVRQSGTGEGSESRCAPYESGLGGEDVG